MKFSFKNFLAVLSLGIIASSPCLACKTGSLHLPAGKCPELENLNEIMEDYRYKIENFPKICAQTRDEDWARVKSSKEMKWGEYSQYWYDRYKEGKLIGTCRQPAAFINYVFEKYGVNYKILFLSDSDKFGGETHIVPLYKGEDDKWYVIDISNNLHESLSEYEEKFIKKYKYKNKLFLWCRKEAYLYPADHVIYYGYSRLNQDIKEIDADCMECLREFIEK